MIQRNVFENPGWYTPYTPYQAEIAQGRLESLLNFQTMVSDLTGMEVANASLLDEATAAAEAMALLLRVHKSQHATTFLVVRADVSAGAATSSRRGPKPLGIDVRVRRPRDRAEFGPDVFGVYVQSPDDHGAVVDLKPIVERAHAAGALVAVGTDLLALAIVTPPGEAGADVVVGNAQRFGVPLGYGGPHAAFFATRETFVRQAPGRIIGVSVDSQGPPRLPHGAADARAAHPPREGDVEHLHGAGAARQHGGVLRRVSRPRGPEGDRAARARPGGAAGAAAERLGWQQTNARVLRHAALRGRRRDRVEGVRAAAEARGINSAIRRRASCRCRSTRP